MAKWIATITNAGTALLNSQVSGADLVIVGAVSSSTETAAEELAKLTEMTNIKQDLTIGSVAVDSNNSTFSIPVTLLNDDLEVSYALKQIGIYAQDPTNTENKILFAVAQIDVARVINLPADAPGYKLEIDLNFQNTNNSNVVIQVTDMSLAGRVEELEAAHEELEAAQIRLNNLGTLENIKEVTTTPQTYVYTSLCKLPSGFSSSAFNNKVVKFNNEIHIFYQTLHYKYDKSTNQFISVSTLPVNCGSAAVYANSIYIGSGYDVYRFNGTGWILQSDMTCPVNLDSNNLGVHRSQLFALNIVSGDPYTCYFYKWDVSTKTWSQVLKQGAINRATDVCFTDSHLIMGWSNSQYKGLMVGTLIVSTYTEKLKLTLSCNSIYKTNGVQLRTHCIGFENSLFFDCIVNNSETHKFILENNTLRPIIDPNYSNVGYYVKLDDDIEYYYIDGSTIYKAEITKKSINSMKTDNETFNNLMVNNIGSEPYSYKSIRNYIFGNGNIGQGYQTIVGHYNNRSTCSAGYSSGTGTGTALCVGIGSAFSPANGFRVNYSGNVYATNATLSTGADYAEYFEWQDGNEENEDRVGYFVTFEDKQKIRKANTTDDYILGIVSGLPCIIGNGDEDWRGRYILDEFGRYIEETFTYTETVINEETGEEEYVTRIGTKYKETPEYNPSQEYIERAKRQEWSAIGMMGVLSVRDDGTCQENGYCTVSDGGIATACERGSINTYRVLERVTKNIVKVLFR